MITRQQTVREEGKERWTDKIHQVNRKSCQFDPKPFFHFVAQRDRPLLALKQQDIHERTAEKDAFLEKKKKKKRRKREREKKRETAVAVTPLKVVTCSRCFLNCSHTRTKKAQNINTVLNIIQRKKRCFIQGCTQTHSCTSSTKDLNTEATNWQSLTYWQKGNVDGLHGIQIHTTCMRSSNSVVSAQQP